MCMCACIYIGCQESQPTRRARARHGHSQQRTEPVCGWRGGGCWRDIVCFASVTLAKKSLAVGRCCG